MSMISVGIVEDDKTIRLSLMQSMEFHPLMALAFAYGSVEELLAAKEYKLPNVILLDIGLPGISGLDGLVPIRDKFNSADIIMLTTYDDTETVFEALNKGACSYISKKTSLKDILEAIRIVNQGGSYMTPSIARKLVDHLSGRNKKKVSDQLSDRQMEIVRALSDGLSYKMTADRLNISIDTVRSHIKKIYRILEVNSKIEVVNLFRK